MKTITIKEFQLLTQKIYGKSANKLYDSWVEEQKRTEQKYNLPHKVVTFVEWCEMYSNLYGLE